ncbi:50S ribosomal protein L4 [Halothermothrix orenii]|uniref:Large ribosomal subunit protein uL4 n=1 Tax=Halothermothrix orenii (strain H 168 / OCM 544 / DSM 9562) TaxID=373903 RepID=RL4_HALOH|nr:50S ribosomal protein L4 [Halothermothrix orenii]B8D0C5.1 RecName: Full=Large ribosomal subunit protein uL4; AltName: Full=50S ribosomal protein L4 [Halothermothrix orenii H 168]ACL68879.1 ribosomal protein L4/L1e [Halothermothrix orenii H 168]
MPQVAKYDTTGNRVGDIDLADNVFNEEVNEHVVHQVVTAQLATMRRGTASTKTRGEVSGGGRKPWRQKGTGRARHGSIRSPLWVGGGIVFGPRPRKHIKKVPKKVKKLALRSILSYKSQNEELIILDELKFDTPKTKQVVELLSNLNLEGKKVLIILPDKDANIYLSARNIPGVKTLVVDALNAFDLLNNDCIVMSEEAVKRVEEVLAR